MFFVIDENNNKIEAYDKEGVLAVLAKAIADGSLSGISANAGFVSRLKCCVGGDTHPVAFVSQAKYNELEASGSLIEDCIYYIIDDTTAEDTDRLLSELNATLTEIIDGRQAVAKADYSEEANKARCDEEGTPIHLHYVRSSDLKAGNIVPHSASQATVLSPTMLTPNQGKISINKTGTYLVCLKQTGTDGYVNYHTDLIVIADLNVPCISLKDGASDMNPYATYASASHTLGVGGTSSSLTYEIAYAYRIA